ncbi:hypothetical protein ACFP2F_05880 [Hymenobacter artigasi]|uniref:Uncharacterized protein n=1 Tax=Hymenobacter artigasi TaxID=2719616 RepID=A0ABX1HET3_9BACT|nr:hypothetical protein [Hymenobacter artigasi]NKI88390.1 hypothetical protein [Hymenobacter artigasi]
MLQPKHQLIERGTLLSSDPREDRKVFAAVGFSDFAAGISAVSSCCCPAAVSDSETVFLCAVSSVFSPAVQSKRSFD